MPGRGIVSQMLSARRFVVILCSVALLLPVLSPHAQNRDAAQQRNTSLLFRDVDVFDGSRVIRHTTVLVNDGMIKAVGDAESAALSSAQVIDGKGKTLLPGLFDAHVHLGQYQVEPFLKDALEFGVTTELEMWGSSPTLALRKKMQASDTLNMADFHTAGIGVTVPHGHPTQMMDAPPGKDAPPPFATLAAGEDAQAFVDARIAEGSDYIKIIYEHRYPTLTRQQVEAIVIAAHRCNRLVVAHISTQQEARDCIAAGVDGLVHIFSDTPPTPGFAKFAAQHRVFVIATLSVFDSIASGSTGSSWWRNASPLASHLTPSMRATLERKMPPGFGGKEKLINAKSAIRALHRAGVPILAGTDAPTPGVAHGVSLHRELELLVQSGLKPIEALASATSEPARFFGFRDRGRIAKGLRADLVLVAGDPSVDITATRNIVGVWKLGVRYARHIASATSEK
jgi:imidazolonepropionase-like amidohydrolase